MNRSNRASKARETLEIMGRGEYRSPSGRIVRIADAMASALKGTRLYRHEDFPDEVAGCEGRPVAPEVRIEVTPETSLEAARRLSADAARPDVLCLNFASAKNPGAAYCRAVRRRRSRWQGRRPSTPA